MDNERLEFLGDAVLELCITEEGFRRYSEAPEGQLTRIRSKLVQEKTLSMLARELGLDSYLLLGRGEEQQGGRQRDALLADALEALVGAVFLDAGFEAARAVVLYLFEEYWPDDTYEPEVKDYKSRLQEVAQERFRDRPVYVLENTRGPEHDKIFDVVVTLPDKTRFEGSGTSVKRAEQVAAKRALIAIE